MNLRHAAMLALIGWYLMIPPVQSCVGQFLGRCDLPPLSQWEIKATFPEMVATRCESYKAGWVEKAQMYMREAESSSGPRTRRMTRAEAAYTAWSAATCVPTEDPRLTAKP